MKRTSAIFAAGGLLLAASLPAAPVAAQETACADLRDLRVINRPGVSDTHIVSAAAVEASDDLPAYCRVTGFVRPAINFEIRLPAGDAWNGKFYMVGCGGLCGMVDADRPGFVNAINHGLRRGYAVSTMDGGHWGASISDGRWAENNRQAEVDWGHRAVTETARVTRSVIEARYDRLPDYSYFQGCSTGGRMANMAALRTPELFDGIISGAPALNYTSLVGTSFAWLVQAGRDAEGEPVIRPGKVPLVRDAVVAECDALDGLEDGVIDDPRACAWEPATLQCPEGEEGEDCLTAAEVETLERWYAGATDAAGEALYPGGLPPGSESFWWLWLTGNEEGSAPLIPAIAQNFLAYMAFEEDPGGSYDIGGFDFESDPEALAFMGEIYNSDDPDLSRFREAGGKLLMWHGWADAIVTPFKTVEYFEEVEALAGGPGSSRDFLRLYMVPGMDHCGLLSGPGIDQSGFDLLTALENWVEHEAPPEAIETTRYDEEGAPDWTRPLCPWPQVAAWDGENDWREAASFTCRTP